MGNLSILVRHISIGIHEHLPKPHPIRLEGGRGEFPYHLKLRTNHYTDSGMLLN